MLSLPLDITHDGTMSDVACHHHLRTSSHSRTASGVAFHHRPWKTNTVKQRRAWHAIITFGQHTRLNDVGRGMPSPPLDSTNDRMTSSMACHNRPWTAHTVGRRRVWYEINALGLHAWSDYGRHGMTSSPLNCTHGQTTSGVA